MCVFDHGPPGIGALAKPELGTRAIVYGDEIGLSSGQLADLLSQAQAWRQRYVAAAEEIVKLGHEVDRELLKRFVDVPRVKELVYRRAELIRELEAEYADVWVALGRTLTDEQYEKLQAIYRREFERLPHPVLGSDAFSIIGSAERKEELKKQAVKV